MTTEFEDLFDALETLIKADPFFPPLSVSEPEPKNMRGPIPGASTSIRDHCVLEDGGEDEVTRDGGAELQWELQATLAVVYAVHGGSIRERRRRCREAKRHLVAIVRKNRTLGLPDPQVYAEFSPTERGSELIVKGAPGFEIRRFNVHVQFVADSAAG